MPIDGCIKGKGQTTTPYFKGTLQEAYQQLSVIFKPIQIQRFVAQKKLNRVGRENRCHFLNRLRLPHTLVKTVPSFKFVKRRED